MKKLLLLVINFCFVAAMGQNLIAPITISLPANPPVNTADWSTAMPPIMINAQSKLRNGQVPGEVIESRILVTIKNGGNKICGMYTQQTAPASNFNSVTKTWNGAAVLSLLGQECVLKPGTYELCVQFYNLNPAAGNGVLGEVCKSFTITDTKQQTYSPPQNILPVNGKVFTKQEAGMPIMLRWIPVLPKPKADVQYKVRIVEILPGQNKTEALRNNTPIDIQEVKNQTQTSAKLAQRCNGCEYVWNVEASKKSQLGDIEMLGTSEATSFKVVDNAAPVVPACNCITITQGVTCHGTLNELPAYAIRDTIVNSCNKTITGWTITSSSGNINGPTSPQTLNTGTNYPAASMLVNSTTGMAILEYVFTFSDNTTCKVMKDLGLPNCNPPCGCGAWTNVAFQTTTATGALQTITRNCNDTVTIRQNANFTINPAFNCTGNNCAVSYRYDVFFPNGTQLYNNVTASAISPVEMNQCNGVYKIVIKPTCGTQQCTPCTIYLKRDCPPACQCGTTGPLSVTINNDTVKTYQCVTAAPIIIPCNKPIQFNAAVNCIPNNNNNCKSVEYILKKGSTVISSGTAATLNYAYTFTQSGTYTLIVKGKCNGVQCDSCIYNLTVNCTTTCPCGTWKSTTATYTSQGGVYNNNPVDCGKGITVDCDKPVTINGTYNCSAPCTSSVAYTVYTPSGSVLTTGASLPVTFTPGMAYAGMMYKVVLKPKCGTTSCDSCIIYVTPKCCDCKSTQCTKKLWYKDVATGLVKDITCSNQTPVILNCDKNYHFFADIKCSPDTNCKMTAIGEFRNAAGALVIQPTAFSNSIAFNIVSGTPGNYTFIIKYYLNGVECSQCTIPIKIICEPNCECGKWGPVTVNNKQYDCGTKIPWKCNALAVINTSYLCNPDGKDCQSKIDWIIKDDNTNTIIKKGNGLHSVSENFSPTVNGNYTIYFNAVCGNKKCPPPCSITFVVSDCSVCSCEKFTFTGTVTSTGKNKEGKCTYAFDGFAYNPCEERKILSLYASAGISFTPASITLDQGNNPVHFVVNNLTGAASGYINAVILINGVKCERRIDISLPPCDNCECGSWESITTKYFFKNTGKQKDLKCGDSLDVDCNKPFKLNADYNCIGTKCDKVMLYYVTGPDGAELVSGESLSVNFTPTKDGVYKIILRANCGSGACPDCIIYLKVVCDPPPCDFCKDFTESSLTQKSYAYGAENNQLDLTQSLNIPAQYKIKQVKVELVAFDWQADNSDCRKCQKNSIAFGVLTETMLKANGIEYEGVTPTAIFNTHEQDINCLPANGAQLGNGSYVKLGISLPWQTSLSCCGDKFSFCIRYTIVTADCKTCTIVKCYTDVPPRQHKIINDGGGMGN